MCCQALSYIDSILAHDYEEYGDHVQWWRHPIWKFLIVPKIRDYVGTVLDESGK
jgi:hypothetical protein